jgi:hypothetical protein
MTNFDVYSVTMRGDMAAAGSSIGEIEIRSFCVTDKTYYELKDVLDCPPNEVFDPWTIDNAVIVSRNVSAGWLRSLFLTKERNYILRELSEMNKPGYWDNEGLTDVTHPAHDDFKFRIMMDKQNLFEKVHDELELKKWDPRNPLGKLEVFRRAEEDGINFID